MPGQLCSYKCQRTYFICCTITITVLLSYYWIRNPSPYKLCCSQYFNNLILMDEVVLCQVKTYQSFLYSFKCQRTYFICCAITLTVLLPYYSMRNPSRHKLCCTQYVNNVRLVFIQISRTFFILVTVVYTLLLKVRTLCNKALNRFRLLTTWYLWWSGGGGQSDP